MSPASNIRPRPTETRGTTYQVRYRPGGRETAWVHVATFPSLKAARACKQWVDGELAAGRRPDLRAALAAQEPVRVIDLANDYGATQTGTAQSKRHRNTVLRLGGLGTREAAEVTGRDIQGWINAQVVGDNALAPSSVRQYLGQLKRVFAWGDIHPNPCEWTHLRVPRRTVDEGEGRRPVDPPSLAEHEAMMGVLTPLYHRPVLTLIENTGLRISEALRLTWGDIDWRRGRIRVPGSKTVAAARWVPLWGATRVMLEATPREDRQPTRLLFERSTDNAVRNAMSRACVAAEVRHLHPHDLRDRFISLCSLAGIPLALIRELSGHEDNTTTLDIYTGLILDEPAGRLAALRDAVAVMYGLSGGAWVVPGDAASAPNTAISRAKDGDGGYRDRSLAADPSSPSPSRSALGDGRDDASV